MNFLLALFLVQEVAEIVYIKKFNWFLTVWIDRLNELLDLARDKILFEGELETATTKKERMMMIFTFGVMFPMAILSFIMFVWWTIFGPYHLIGIVGLVSGTLSGWGRSKLKLTGVRLYSFQIATRLAFIYVILRSTVWT